VNPRAQFPIRKNADGSVLVAVLWCLALLSVLVVGVLYAASLNLRAVKNQGDLIQAHYLAVAGMEKAKALLHHDAVARRRAGINHTGELYDAPHHFRDVSFGRGQFRVFHRGGLDQGHAMIHGIPDEERRLHLNKLPAEILQKLEGIEPEAVTAIIGYREKVQPFRTTGELLMVRGVSRDLFLGDAANHDRRLGVPDERESTLDPGWSGLLTVHSSGRNVNASGEARVHLQEADENELAAVPGISSELARAIVQSRGRNRLESLADLLDVRAADSEESTPQPGAQPSQSPDGRQIQAASQPARPGSGSTGERVISADLLMQIADHVTTDSDSDQPGLVNINTAEATVLAMLPGLDPQVARAIVSFRQSSGFFANAAELLKVPAMNEQRFRQVAPHVTARSDTFRIVSEGTVASTGARRRIEAIVRLGVYDMEMLSYRENL
jgi:competence ComEA-like helix-hairpin-helix protein